MNQEKRRNILSKIALPSFLLALLGLDLLFQALYGYVGGQDSLNWRAVWFTVLWVLLFGGILLLLPRALSRILMVLLSLFHCILVMVHAVMFHLFGNFFGFSDMLYAGDGAAFFSFKYVQMRKLLAVGVIAVLALTVLAVIYLPKRKYRWTRVVLSAVLIAGTVFGLIRLNRSMLVEYQTRETMSWSVAMKEDPNLELDPDMLQYTEFKNPNICLPLCGLYQYTWRDLEQTFLTSDSRDRARTVAELDAYFSSRPEQSANALTGALAGKNLIMIMVESLDSWMLTEDYMPNLYGLMQKSLYFDHFYTPLYLNAGTFSTEFASQTGMIPPISGVSTDAYAENTLPASLARLFAREGYTVNSFHSASPKIYNRGQIHRNLGFEAYHSYVQMGMDDYMIDYQMLNGFDQMINRNQPFFTFIITYSGHGSYTAELDNIAQPHMQQAREAVAASGVTGSPDTMEQYTRAVSQIMVTDEFIGGLVARLEEENLLEDTALIIYGDHFCKYLTDTDFLLSIKNVDNRNLLCNTPLLLYSQSLEPRTVEKYAATVDLYPTVCNAFQLPVDLRYFVGDDIFSEDGGIVYWRDSSFFDGKTYVDSTQSSMLTAEQQAVYNLVHKKLELSWKTFQTDYFFYTDPLLGK